MVLTASIADLTDGAEEEVYNISEQRFMALLQMAKLKDCLKPWMKNSNILTTTLSYSDYDTIISGRIAA